MFREIITSSITLANSGIVIGGNIAPAVSGLTVYGDISATGKIYVTGSGTGPVTSSLPSISALGDIIKATNTDGVTAWSSGRVNIEELSSAMVLKDGALVTYVEASGKFIALEPEEQIASETSYIKQLAKCTQCRPLNNEALLGFAASTNDNRVVAWGWLPNDIFNTSNKTVLATENIRVPFWSNYDGYLSAAAYSPYGGDFIDAKINEGKKYSILDLYWSRHAAMALLSSSDDNVSDVWVAGKNARGQEFTGNNQPNSIIKTKYNNFLIANNAGAGILAQNAGGIYLFNPNKDISAIQKYAAGMSRDIIPDITNSSELSAEDYFYVSEASLIRKINIYGESISTIDFASPSQYQLIAPNGMAMVKNQVGAPGTTGKNLLYVCDVGTNHNKIKVFDVGTTVTGIATIGSGTVGHVDGATDGSTITFTQLKKIDVDPTNPNILYATDQHAVKRIFRKSNGAWKVDTISSTTQGNTIGTINLAGGTTQFNNPNGIKVSPDGKFVYVADQDNKRIIQLQITGTNDENNFTATPSIYVSNNIKTSASFNQPMGLTKDNNNNIYIADYANHVIRKMTYNPVTNTYGDVTLFAGIVGKSGYIPSTTPRLSTKFYGPVGIVFHAASNSLYVTNIGHFISKIDLDSNNVSVIAGKSAGFKNNTSGLNASFNQPRGISVGTFNSNDYLFIADTANHAIRRIQIGSSFPVETIVGGIGAATVLNVGYATSIKINAPYDTYYNTSTNEVYFTHLHSIQKLNLVSNNISTVAGTGVAGDNNGSNANVSKLKNTRGLAVSGTDMFVVDSGNFKIKKISNFSSNNDSSRVITTYAGTGTAGYKDTNATSSMFGSSINFLFQNVNELIISENHYIRAVYINAGIPFVKTINGTKAAGFADTKNYSQNIEYAGLYVDSNNIVSFTDLLTDTAGSINNGKIEMHRKLEAGVLGIGEGFDPNGKSTCGFIKVNAYDLVTNSIPKFKKIQYVGDTAGGIASSALLFAALDEEDSLWVWGASKDGAFGTGQINSIGPTKLYQFEKNVKDFRISCSTNGVSLFSIITKDNKLFSAGDNTYGQLGRGVISNIPDKTNTIFKQCKKSSTVYVDDAERLIVSNELGARNNLYIDKVGDVWSCGEKSTGINGNITANQEFFKRVPGISDVKYLHAVSQNTFNDQTVFAIKTNGELWSWGYNKANIGQCMQNNLYTDTIITPGNCWNYDKNDVVRDAVTLFSNDNLASGRCTVAFLDSQNDLYLGGYSTGTNLPDYNVRGNTIPYFRKFNMRNITPDVILVGPDSAVHRKNGTVYKIDELGSRKLF